MKKNILIVLVAIIAIAYGVYEIKKSEAMQADMKKEQERQEKKEQDIQAKTKKIESLQAKLYDLAKHTTNKHNAKATYIIVMDSTNGNLIGVVDSTVAPKAYNKDETIFAKNVLQYSYEPGSIVMPIFYAHALDQNNTSPKHLVNCFNGEYKIGSKTITDYHKFEYLSLEDVIVHSSNIGIVQITKNMGAMEIFNIQKRFGFGERSIFNYDELGERKGYIVGAQRLQNEIYKATTSYGYGLHANLLQLVRAYSVFNNDGVLIYPKDIHTYLGTAYEDTVIDEPERVISASSAKQVKKTLIEVVKRGTGTLSRYDGVEVGGKTGTSHMVENNMYVNKYYNTFIGFANDKKSKYVIGVLVVDPRKEYIASKTAAPTFKKVVDILVKQKYIKQEL